MHAILDHYGSEHYSSFLMAAHLITDPNNMSRTHFTTKQLSKQSLLTTQTASASKYHQFGASPRQLHCAKVHIEANEYTLFEV